MYGPIIIHPKKDRPTPFSLISNNPAAVRAMEKAVKNAKPVIVGDYRAHTSHDSWEIIKNAGFETGCYDSILFNGKGRVDCWSPEKLAASGQIEAVQLRQRRGAIP